MGVILVTGTSTGFGKLIVKTLSEKGHQVAATMRVPFGRNNITAQELNQLMGVKVYELDVEQDESVKKTVQDVLNDFGTIDVVVNNAGVFGVGLAESYSIEKIQSLFNINFYGALRVIKAVLPSMRERKEGLIINMSSVIALFSLRGTAVYCASKCAIEGFSLTLAQELKPLEIESILIEPGIYPTEIFSKSVFNADEIKITASYNGLWEQMDIADKTTVGELIQKHNPNPQAVANKVLELIDMPKGTRPLRNPIDDIAKNISVETAHAINIASQKLYDSYFA